MPADLSKKSALVYDHGAFVELAFRLARPGGFGTVYYCDPTWEEAFAKIDHAVIGDGFPDIIRVKEPWALIDEGNIDIVVFPDVHHGELQLHLEKMGMPVWGGRTADALECNKWRFKKIQEHLGMNVAEFDLVKGLDELRQYCMDPKNKDRWIKLTPQFRGNRETFHHEDYERSRQILDAMGMEFGPLGHALRFLCEHPLTGKLEGGLDTYTIDGEHPETVVSGWEKKDKAYFAEVVKWSEIAEELRSTIEPIFPILKERGCRQMISTEVMIEDRVLLEPTIRFPSPAGEEQMELYSNFPQIIWEGANGKLIEPELDGQFACEVMLEHTGNENYWRGIRVPESVRRWVKLYNVCAVGGELAVAPSPGNKCIGAVVGIGNSTQDALEHLKENCAALKDEPVSTHMEAVVELIEEIQEAQAQGKAFKSVKLPDVAEVVES